MHKQPIPKMSPDSLGALGRSLRRAKAFHAKLATQDEVLTAEMNLVEAKIRTAEAVNVASLPALLKEREGILQRAFLNAKSKFEAGLIGIDEFSRFVADLIHAKFTSLIVAERLAGSLDTVSPNDAR
jgi:hypothetical protein